MYCYILKAIKGKKEFLIASSIEKVGSKSLYGIGLNVSFESSPTASTTSTVLDSSVTLYNLSNKNVTFNPVGSLMTFEAWIAPTFGLAKLNSEIETKEIIRGVCYAAPTVIENNRTKITFFFRPESEKELSKGDELINYLKKPTKLIFDATLPIDEQIETIKTSLEEQDLLVEVDTSNLIIKTVPYDTLPLAQKVGTKALSNLHNAVKVVKTAEDLVDTFAKTLGLEATFNWLNDVLQIKFDYSNKTKRVLVKEAKLKPKVRAQLNRYNFMGHVEYTGISEIKATLHIKPSLKIGDYVGITMPYGDVTLYQNNITSIKSEIRDPFRVTSDKQPYIVVLLNSVKHTGTYQGGSFITTITGSIMSATAYV